MSEGNRRRELRDQYKNTHPQAAVFRIVNNRNDRVLLGSTLNLTSLQNKLQFAHTTNTATVLDRRLSSDIKEFGITAFSLDVLELLEVTPEMSREQILADLATLEALWREKLDPSLLY